MFPGCYCILFRSKTLIRRLRFSYCLASDASCSIASNLQIKAKNAFIANFPALIAAKRRLPLFYIVQLRRLASRVASEFQQRQSTPLREILPALFDSRLGAYAFLILVSFNLAHYFFCEVVFTFFDSFTNSIASE